MQISNSSAYSYLSESDTAHRTNQVFVTFIHSLAHSLNLSGYLFICSRIHTAYPFTSSMKLMYFSLISRFFS